MHKSKENSIKNRTSNLIREKLHLLNIMDAWKYCIHLLFYFFSHSHAYCGNGRNLNVLLPRQKSNCSCWNVCNLQCAHFLFNKCLMTIVLNASSKIVFITLHRGDACSRRNEMAHYYFIFILVTLFYNNLISTSTITMNRTVMTIGAK